ncbi:IS66 family insertion sequence element accessory protein TnpB [Rhizobium gallicum]
MGRAPTRLKLLAYDGTGIILATKWLESGRFVWPRSKTA